MRRLYESARWSIPLRVFWAAFGRLSHASSVCVASYDQYLAYKPRLADTASCREKADE